MKILGRIQEKKFQIECGEGNQSLEWLIFTLITRYLFQKKIEKEIFGEFGSDFGNKINGKDIEFPLFIQTKNFYQKILIEETEIEKESKILGKEEKKRKIKEVLKEGESIKIILKFEEKWN
ncbi:hypothetical protein M0811_05132 [Anaeramoeba ignava]|uniref:Uncharacterized protein n=1 Tax=Anaeramoeba ignava TaxID=1746090 RepID=A0A9Q0RH32_ANAIG|nr:hypothetical protein M0811_05132 [Anaeramoeba ignava]